MSAVRKRPSLSLKAREAISGWLFVSPILTGFLIFFVGPLIAVFYYSTTEWNLLSQQSRFVGMENYVDALTRNETFWDVLVNSLVFAAGLVPLNMALALGLAIALSKSKPGAVFFRTVFFAPVITSAVAWAIIWTFLLQHESGAVNQGLSIFGIDGPNWLHEPDWAMASVIVTRIFKTVGLNMILYIAALQSIPRDYEEAARLEGANSWDVFRRVTWPLLAPTTLVIMVITVVGSLKVFDHIYLMTGGGPQNGTMVLAFYIYEQGFKFFNTGYAAALAVVLFVLILALTVLQMFLKAVRK
ncbi:MAG: sugar ABC transporter permease [Thalassospira sp.]|uniref:carbohydrate ABC transporter permease n=1 Tax=Thalassospira sp. TaxID=1912094 RepID=UPI0032EBF8AE